MPLGPLSLTRTLARRRGCPVEAAGRERGQISVLILGLFMIVVVLILGTIDVTAAQLARMRLLDIADSMALDAADDIDEGSAYAGGVTTQLALTEASVKASASEHLALTPTPGGISEWSLSAPTGTPDGTTAVVSVSARADLPMSGWILESLGGGVTISVTSRARAPLR